RQFFGMERNISTSRWVQAWNSGRDGPVPASALGRDRLQLKVEHVQNKESLAVDQHNVSANDGLHISGRRRREILHNLGWAGMHLAAQSGRERSPHDQLTLKSRRQAVAFRQPGRQMVVVRTIPAVQVAIVIAVMAAILIAIVLLVAIS